MTRLVHGFALVSVLHQSQGFSGVRPFDQALRTSAPASARPLRIAGGGARSPRRLGPSAALLSPAGSGTPRSFRNTSCARHHPTSGDGRDDHHQRRPRPPPRRCFHEGVIERSRRRPTAGAAAAASSSPSSLCAVRGSSTGEVELREEEGEGVEATGGLASDAGETAVRAPNPKKGGTQKNKKKKEKSVLGKAGDALKATFNLFMAASTVVSLALAAEAIWQLHGTQLTLSNAVPTLTKLLPLTGIGVFGAAQLVGLVARVVRVIVTLPIMLSGTWVILQNAPKLLPQGSDLGGAGSLAALLATPEVLEAAAVVALLGGTVIWALNFATGAVGVLMSGQRDPSEEELEDEDELA